MRSRGESRWCESEKPAEEDCDSRLGESSQPFTLAAPSWKLTIHIYLSGLSRARVVGWKRTRSAARVGDL